MRAADGGEEQRIKLRGDDAVVAWVDGHIPIFSKLTGCSLLRVNSLDFRTNGGKKTVCQRNLL